VPVIKHALTWIIANKVRLGLFDLVDIVEENHRILGAILCPSEDIPSYPCCTYHGLIFVAKEDIDDLVLVCNILKDVLVHQLILLVIAGAR